MGDEARHNHLGDMGGTHQGDLTVAAQRRGQVGANAGSLPRWTVADDWDQRTLLCLWHRIPPTAPPLK
jgi:hypothetical protein